MLPEGEKMMRTIAGLLVFAMAACGSEGEPKRDAQPAQASPPAAPVAPVQASAMMAIPSDPQALERLEGMGYTVHQEEGHLHAPGVKSCPAMADGPVM